MKKSIFLLLTLMLLSVNIFSQTTCSFYFYVHTGSECRTGLPGTYVSLFNNGGTDTLQHGYTDNNGLITFTDLKDGFSYDFHAFRSESCQGANVNGWTVSCSSGNYTTICVNPPACDRQEIGNSENLIQNSILNQNYPNPFNPITKISYSISFPNNVKLVVYDLLGKEVTTLVNSYQNTGSYSVNFDASNLSSGVYIYKIVSGDFIDIKRMLVVK